MRADVIFVPRDLQASDLGGRTVVVFDVLRATTSIAAALAAGVSEIYIFRDLAAAADAAAHHLGPKLLCGEERCLCPPGFDLGNSPGAYRSELHAGRAMFLCTTNGTRAIIAAEGAKAIIPGALVNAGAVARAVIELAADVTLLCAGTGGVCAIEDIVGAGAVLDAMARSGTVTPATDRARVALRLFRDNRQRLRDVLADSQGGRNVQAAGLGADLDFAAHLDALPVVGLVHGNPLRIIRAADVSAGSLA